MEIKNNNDMRAAATLINDNMLKMCNSNNIDDIVKYFSDTKDMLVELFRYNASRNFKNNS
jgi:hypothetical protein